MAITQREALAGGVATVALVSLGIPALGVPEVQGITLVDNVSMERRAGLVHDMAPTQYRMWATVLRR